MFILSLLALALAINTALFLIAFKLQSDKLTDASYSFTFMVLAAAALAHSSQLNAYNVLLFALVVVWALRIGGFLVYRVMKVGKDRRFDDLRASFVRFGKFWIGQAITAWVVMLPAMWAINQGSEIQAAALLGLGIWAAGLIIETAADYQKYRFRNDYKNKDRWIDSGVWAYARHPNYFGEILVWTGLYVYAFTELSAPEKVVGLASPILITLILVFVSGVPILEKSAEKRWGKSPAYQKYKAGTRLLVPLPRFRARKL